MSLVRAAKLALLATMCAGSLAAQHTLRDDIPDLFRFGNCGGPLCLSSTVSAPTGHGTHFLNSAQTDANSVIQFLNTAIAVGVSSVPISSGTSGITFNIVGGAPVPTSGSAGPIFGERVQTLGRGRFLVGANVTGVAFTAVRGVPLDNVAFVFTHQNTCRSDTAWAPGQPCPNFPQDSTLGSPVFENDLIAVNMSLNLKLQVATLNLTYGLSNRIDVGVAVPLVRADLSGGSIARVVPFGSPTPHFFGTSADPVLSAGARVSGNATGIGDVAARLKVNLGGSDHGVGLLTEARFPTGNEAQFLGSGKFALRVLGIASARYGNFSPHLNAGYFYRAGKDLTDAVLTTAGFDHLMAPWATLAVDFIGQWQAQQSPLALPGPVTFTSPSRRTVTPTNLPGGPDNLLDGSIGFKFLTRSGVTIVTNALVPLNDGGIRGRIVWSGGAEYNF